jgi:hypothetical protein
MRDTAAWALGRAMETLHLPGAHPPLLSDDAALHAVLGALLPALQDASCPVADKAAWALKCVAAGYEGAGEDTGTSPMSPVLQTVLQVRLTLSCKLDGPSTALSQHSRVHRLAGWVEGKPQRCTDGGAGCSLAALAPQTALMCQSHLAAMHRACRPTRRMCYWGR